MTDKVFRLYGVSSGNGNDGVSHIFADYYVRTAEPWRLAELALVSEFKPGAGQSWAKDSMQIDGESDYGISATLYDPPCDDSEDGGYPDLWRCIACGESGEGTAPDDCCDDPDIEDASEDAEDGRHWSENNGAWMIVEVFPADSDDTRDRPIYDSIADCFDAKLLAAHPPESADMPDNATAPFCGAINCDVHA